MATAIPRQSSASGQCNSSRPRSVVTPRFKAAASTFGDLHKVVGR
jgi:hypothetical protein